MQVLDRFCFCGLLRCFEAIPLLGRTNDLTKLSRTVLYVYGMLTKKCEKGEGENQKEVRPNSISYDQVIYKLTI